MSVALVFAAGYAVADHRRTGGAAPAAATLGLKGTRAAPRAHARVEVWNPRAGNWPVTLSVAGLPRLPPRAYYEVFLGRGGAWASFGRFRVTSPSKSLTLTLNAPYRWRKGDSWLVLREISGRDTGTPVLRSL
jgi:hypothetical protein